MVKKTLQVPLYCQLQKFSVLIHLGNNHLTFTGLKGGGGGGYFYFLFYVIKFYIKKKINRSERYKKKNQKSDPAVFNEKIWKCFQINSRCFMLRKEIRSISNYW